MADIRDPQGAANTAAVGTIGGMDSSDTTRLRDLEAEAFRTGRSLADMQQWQATAFANIDSIGNAIGNVGDRPIAERLDRLDERIASADGRLDAIEDRLDTVNAQLGEILSLLRGK